MKLQVYISQHCTSCNHSVALGQAVASHFDDVTVQIIDLDDPSTAKPDAVFAVPTFLLDGQLLCLGNQEEEWLTRRLEQVRAGKGWRISAGR
jgi:hypothetical protein